MGMTKYLPRFLTEFILDRRRSRNTWKAILLASDKRFAEAADLYSTFADRHLADRTLHYSTLCKYSMENWIEAKDPANALVQARKALRAFGNNDGEWLKYSAGDHAGVLVEMATQLHAARFTAEAEIFADEVNAQFERYKVPFRCILDPDERSPFPAQCEQCGGSLPSSTHRESIECPFCKVVIYAYRNSSG